MFMSQVVLSTPTKNSTHYQKLQLNTPSTDPNTPFNDEVNQYKLNSSNSSPQSILGRVSSLRGNNSIGSLWTVEMTKLRLAGSHFEAIECLRSVRSILQEIDKSDRIKFCKQDFELAIKVLKRNSVKPYSAGRNGLQDRNNNRLFWCEDLFKEIVDITVTYFDMNPFHTLNDDVMKEILLFIPLKDLTQTVPLISKEFNSIASCDDVWNILYREKFILTNRINEESTNNNRQIQVVGGRKEAFKQRYLDPQVGDKVEVAWRGKFRLETQDIYQGLAWWFAEVMEKSDSTDNMVAENGDVSSNTGVKYKIRYVGWESRWDKWVSRTEIRWLVAKNTVELIEVGDTVELLCSGANVPGAWLECKVKKIRNNKYSLGRVVSTGNLWVERSRLRLVKKGSAQNARHQSNSSSLDINRRFRSSNSFLRNLSIMCTSCFTTSVEHDRIAHDPQQQAPNTTRNVHIRRHHRFLNDNLEAPRRLPTIAMDRMGDDEALEDELDDEDEEDEEDQRLEQHLRHRHHQPVMHGDTMTIERSNRSSCIIM